MKEIVVKIGPVGSGPLFPEVTNWREASLKKVSILEAGMTSGAASVGLIADLPDGSSVIVQISAASFHWIDGALRGAEARFARKKAKSN